MPLVESVIACKATASPDWFVQMNGHCLLEKVRSLWCSQVNLTFLRCAPKYNVKILAMLYLSPFPSTHWNLLQSLQFNTRIFECFFQNGWSFWFEREKMFQSSDMWNWDVYDFGLRVFVMNKVGSGGLLRTWLMVMKVKVQIYFVTIKFFLHTLLYSKIG